MIIIQRPGREQGNSLRWKTGGQFFTHRLLDNPRGNPAKPNQNALGSATFQNRPALPGWQDRRRNRDRQTEMNGTPLPSSWPMPRCLGICISEKRRFLHARGHREAEKHIGDSLAQRRLGAAVTKRRRPTTLTMDPPMKLELESTGDDGITLEGHPA